VQVVHPHPDPAVSGDGEACLPNLEGVGAVGFAVLGAELGQPFDAAGLQGFGDVPRPHFRLGRGAFRVGPQSRRLGLLDLGAALALHRIDVFNRRHRPFLHRG
jgi:hypothetical protein